jgi:hypothetical protein
MLGNITMHNYFNKNILYYIILYYIIFGYSFIYSQEIYKLKDWKESNCTGIENLSTTYLFGELVDIPASTNKYILSPQQADPTLADCFQFTPDKDNSTLENIGTYKTKLSLSGDTERPFVKGSISMYQNIVLNATYTSPNSKISILKSDGTVISMLSYTISNYNVTKCYSFSTDIMNHYFFSATDNKLYKVALKTPSANVTPYDLPEPAKTDTSAIFVTDTLYYFSESGLCAMKISDADANSREIIPDTNNIDPKSLLVVDDSASRIWIINPTDGVIEYKIAEKTTKPIATYPAISKSGSPKENACFYSDEFLYFIAVNNKLYTLDILAPEPDDPDNPDPDNPDKPKKPWEEPKVPTIEGGYKFVGLAEFFAMLNEYYLSIMCNGMPMMFTFDPRMCAFHLAPKAPHFDPANMNNAFMDDKYFYIYNPDRNTITCTNTETGMETEIACYENMPEDIIQVVFAKNTFFILTKSGENHIARMAGHKLEYVSSWKLDDWTPRTGASIVAMKNEIYVFGGQALSDSKEESSTCYNELYVYDLQTKSSEKLDVASGVTARYNAKILASKRWGKLWIIGGKNASDSTALDIWEFNTNTREWTHVNDIPAKNGNASASYDEKMDTLSLLVTPEAEESRLFSVSSKSRNIIQASSEAVVYQMKDLAGASDSKDQSGKSCGCLGLEFLFAIAGLLFFRRCRKN